jgi:hypothetical protein
MQIVSPPTLIFLSCFSLPASGADVFGVWRINFERSTNAYTHSVVVRFEPHRRGEVFTLDLIDRDGRSTTSSTILYLDGKARDFDGFGCSGTQISQRLETQTVEIVRACKSGDWTRLVRHLSNDAKELVLEITEQHADRRFERKLILERR